MPRKFDDPDSRRTPPQNIFPIRQFSFPSTSEADKRSRSYFAGRTASSKGHDTMTADHRFKTYTQLEKAYRRILTRRRPVRQERRKLQTRSARSRMQLASTGG